MRRYAVAALGILLLMAPAPAGAQTGDPLGLAATGIIIPFFHAGGDVSILETSAPVGAAGVDMVFFNASCARGDSFHRVLTPNDIEHLPTNGFLPGANGLITIFLSAAPIHARVYWFNVATGRARILEPITLEEYGGSRTWNPLRTGATFFAPAEDASFQTVLYLICPKTTIQGDEDAFFSSGLFPTIVPPFLPHYTGFGAMRGRIYDTDETFIADIQFDCDCLFERRLPEIASVYANPIFTGSGTFTEIQSNPNSPFGGPGLGFAFTGYKALTVHGAGLDFFGRLSNNSRADAGGGVPTPGNR